MMTGTKDKYVLTIKAEDRPGLLHLISGILERKLIRITSFSLAPTDVHGIVLLSAEVTAAEEELNQVALNLANVIEVFAVEVKRYEQVACLRAAYFKIQRDFVDTPKYSALNKYGAVITNWYSDAFLAAKYGSDAAILNLYNELDGPHLLGFSQTGVITDSKLIGEDQSSVINRLAA